MKRLTVSIFTFLLTFSVFAQQGTTHDHGLDDATVSYILQNYCGLHHFSTGTDDPDNNNWGFLTNATNKIDDRTFVTAPTLTAQGDIILVEVNDYWRGSEWDATPNVYNQIKYGVKAIHKLDNPIPIKSGTLYHITLTTNRFFFAGRTGKIYNTDNGLTLVRPTDGVTCDDGGDLNGQQYPSYLTQNTKIMPFRWYNEVATSLSYDKNSENNWDKLTAIYDSVMNGAYIAMQHVCLNTLEMNHFNTLADKETVDATFEVPVFLYIPSGTDLGSLNKGPRGTAKTNMYIFVYNSILEGELIEDPSTELYFDYSNFWGDLTWHTTFQNSTSNGITLIADRSAGVKEVSKIYRRIVGTDNWELIAEDLVNTYDYVDKTLPRQSDDYDVEYYIVTESYEYDANGNRGDKVIDDTTNTVTMHVPGTGDGYEFEFQIKSEHDGSYNPNAGNIDESTNTVTNNVSVVANDDTPDPYYFKKGDQLILNRILANGEEEECINTVEITSELNRTPFHETVNMYSLAPRQEISNKDDKKSPTYTIPSSSIAADGAVQYITITAQVDKFDGKDGTLLVNGVAPTSVNGKNYTWTIPYDPNADITFSSNSSAFNAQFSNISITGDKEGYSFDYTVNGEPRTWYGTEPPTKQEFLDAVASCTDTFTAPVGYNNDAQYVLDYNPSYPTRTSKQSNKIDCLALRTTSVIENAYRSGTPDRIHNAAEELYSFDIKFKPIDNEAVNGYNVWCNANEIVARIAQTEDNRYVRMFKDNEGQWTIEGNEMSAGEDGMIAMHVDYASNQHVRENEFDDSESNDLGVFYSVEVTTKNNATYGNEDMSSGFTGISSELVVNASAQFYKGNNIQTGNYRADITWEKIKNMTHVEDDLLLGYTVYRWTMTGETGEEPNYVPITKYITGSETTGFITVGQSEDEATPYFFTPDVVATTGFLLVDFVNYPEWSINSFPAAYYVKAHFQNPVAAPNFLKDEVNGDQNVIEKNSNALFGREQIVTGIADINIVDSPVVEVNYYNMLGAKIANPDNGSVVIVEQSHANGKVTTIKKKY